MSLGSLNPDEIRISESGLIYFAPIGSPAPTDVTTALSSAWFNAGYVDEDSGVSLTPDVSVEAVKKWQSKMPVKYYVTEVTMEVAFTMNQFNAPNTELYYYGAQWVQEPNGHVHMTVSSNITTADLERAMVVEFTDDLDQVTRYYFERGIVIERDEQALNKSDVKLGITYHVMDAGGEMFQIFSNNSDLYSGAA